jgi:hypothetical protein
MATGAAVLLTSSSRVPWWSGSRWFTTISLTLERSPTTALSLEKYSSE